MFIIVSKNDLTCFIQSELLQIDHYRNTLWWNGTAGDGSGSMSRKRVGCSGQTGDPNQAKELLVLALPCKSQYWKTTWGERAGSWSGATGIQYINTCVPSDDLPVR